MDINNIQALIAQGLLTDVASVDPNKAYVAVGVFQPGNRQSGAAGNAYPSYAMPISEFLAAGGGITTAANVGTTGSGLYKNTTGSTLNFRNIVNGGGIGVAINNTDDTIELTNQNTKIVDMTDTFFGTLAINDLIQWDGTAWVNVQPNSFLTGYIQGLGTIGYVPRWDLTDTLGNSIIFDDGLGKVGIGTITLGATVHIKGVNALFANYALRVDNGASSDSLFSVANNGSVGINAFGGDTLYSLTIGSKSTGAIRMFSSSFVDMLTIKEASLGTIANYNFFGGTRIGIGAAASATNTLFIEAFSGLATDYSLNIATTGSLGTLFTVRNDGNVGIGTSNLYGTFNVHKFNTGVSIDLSYNTINRSVIFTAPDANAAYGISSVYDDKMVFGRFNVAGSANGYGFVCGVNGDFTLNADFYTGTSAIDFIYKASTRNVGIGTDTPTSKLHVKGSTITSSDYAFKIDNAATSTGQLFNVRNDGFIQAGTFANSYFYFDPSLTLPSYEAKVTDGVTASQFLLDKDTVNINNAHGQIVMASGDLQLTATTRIFLNAALINAVLIPVGEAAVSIGELYVDTAANILANGDLIVARKV